MGRRYGKPKKLNEWWKIEDRGFTTPCWIWQGFINRDGYGCYTTSRTHLAHRYVYESYMKKSIGKLDLDHLCTRINKENKFYCRACVNPSHMEPTTHHENCKRR